MKCVYCGAELKEGCIYCSKCGKEVQLVPDYNIIEDDYLKALLEEENRRSQEKLKANLQSTAPENQNKEQTLETVEDNGSKKPSNKASNKKTIIIISIIAAVCVIGIVAALLIHANVKKNQESSVDYQIEMAKDEIGRAHV